MGIPTITVGLITTPELADEIVRSGRADLVAWGESCCDSLIGHCTPPRAGGGCGVAQAVRARKDLTCVQKSL